MNRGVLAPAGEEVEVFAVRRSLGIESKFPRDLDSRAAPSAGTRHTVESPVRFETK